MLAAQVGLAVLFNLVEQTFVVGSALQPQLNVRIGSTLRSSMDIDGSTLVYIYIYIYIYIFAGPTGVLDTQHRST